MGEGTTSEPNQTEELCSLLTGLCFDTGSRYPWVYGRTGATGGRRWNKGLGLGLCRDIRKNFARPSTQLLLHLRLFIYFFVLWTSNLCACVYILRIHSVVLEFATDTKDTKEGCVVLTKYQRVPAPTFSISAFGFKSMKVVNGDLLCVCLSR